MNFNNNDVINDGQSGGGNEFDINIDVDIERFGSDIFIACPSRDLFHWHVKRHPQLPKRRRDRICFILMAQAVTGHVLPLSSAENVDVDFSRNINEKIDTRDVSTMTDAD